MVIPTWLLQIAGGALFYAVFTQLVLGASLIWDATSWQEYRHCYKKQMHLDALFTWIGFYFYSYSAIPRRSRLAMNSAAVCFWLTLLLLASVRSGMVMAVSYAIFTFLVPIGTITMFILLDIWDRYRPA